MRFLALLVCSLFGFVVAHVLHMGNIQHAELYSLCITALLAVGLYASTYGISLTEARNHSRLILSAVTVGVLAKALIIGLSLWMLFGDPFFIILGIVVAQIDPLSVASLMRGERLSKKAKTIIACWASFDDPVTVILAFYVPVILGHSAGLHLSAATAHWESGLFGLVRDLAANTALPAAVFVVWKLLHIRRAPAPASLGRGGTYVLAAAAMVLAVAQSLMLGIAIVGLFLRPKKIGALLDGAIVWISGIAMFLIGMLLVHGIAIWKGIALGVAAYGSQIIVGWIFTGHLSLRDRLHIAFAQQNGTTAIILALLFEPIHAGTIAIVAPAVVVVNSLHALANAGIDRFLLRRSSYVSIPSTEENTSGLNGTTR